MSHPTPYSGTAAGHLPLSPAVRAGDFVFVSGQASTDHTGTYVADDFAGEMNRAIVNVRRILAEAGAEMKEVVQVQAYLGDSSYRDEYNTLYSNYFRSPFPSRTTTFGGLGDLKFEIAVIAYSPVFSED